MTPRSVLRSSSPLCFGALVRARGVADARAPNLIAYSRAALVREYHARVVFCLRSLTPGRVR